MTMLKEIYRINAFERFQSYYQKCSSQLCFTEKSNTTNPVHSKRRFVYLNLSNSYAPDYIYIYNYIILLEIKVWTCWSNNYSTLNLYTMITIMSLGGIVYNYDFVFFYTYLYIIENIFIYFNAIFLTWMMCYIYVLYIGTLIFKVRNVSKY